MMKQTMKFVLEVFVKKMKIFVDISDGRRIRSYLPKRKFFYCNDKIMLYISIRLKQNVKTTDIKPC